MAKFSLRRYDTQARASLVIAGVSVVSLLGLAFVVFKNVDFSQQVIYWGNQNRRLAIYLIGIVTMLLAGAGFGFGLNSAGQRRNDRPQLSWIGFFLSSAVICATLVILYIFRSRGEFIG